MTEYWVSQGKKWCEFCKLFISNNPATIRNHELGQRHKDNVAKRLTTMREESVAKEKAQKEAALALQQIEAKASRSYQKDVASFKAASNSHALEIQGDGEEWEFDKSSGYYYNQSNGLHYDPNSGFYYSDNIGKWVSQEEAYAAIQVASDSSNKQPLSKKPPSSISSVSIKQNDNASQSGPAPGPVVSAPLNSTRSVKGAPSALAVNKRKREHEKPKAKAKVVSPEEKAALKAREAARKRVEEREKLLLGLYKH